MVLFAVAALVLVQGKPVELRVANFPGGFTIDIPRPLIRLQRDKDGETSMITDSWIALQGNWSYSVSLSWLTRKDPDSTPPHRALGQVANGWASEGAVKVHYQKDLVLKGWPGIEMEGTSSGFAFRSRAFLVNGKLFQASVTRSVGQSAATRESDFIYSMNIPKSAGVGPQKMAGPELSVYPLTGFGISLRFPEKPEKGEDIVGSETEPGKMTRFTAGFGNREYACVCIDVPDTEMTQLDEHRQEIFEMINSKMLEGMGGKAQTDSTYQLEKLDVFSSISKLALGLSARIDTFVKGQRVYTLVAVAPTVLMKSDEVKGFFSSAKLD